MKIRVIHIITGLLVLFSPLSYAEVEISGYASFSGTIASAKDLTGTKDSGVVYNNGLANKNANFNNDDNLIGLQISAPVSDKIDMTLVLQANGGTSNYNVEAQWGYATYKFNDELSLRIGKYKGSFYMVSDYKDVGYAYPWVRPPLEVYSTNPIEALNGLDLVYQTNVGNMTLLTELYVGSGTHSATMLPGTIDGWATYLFPGTAPPIGTPVSFETPNSKGLNVSLSGDIGTVRLGYYTTDVNAASFGVADKEGSFLGFGFNIDWNNVVVYSEYVQRDTAPGALAFAFPDQDAYYVTLGYRMGKYLPYLTVADLAKGKDVSPVAQEQSSVALGLRYEVSDTSVLKFEVLKVTPEDSGSSYGLFDSPTKEGTVATVKFDVIF